MHTQYVHERQGDTPVPSHQHEPFLLNAAFSWQYLYDASEVWYHWAGQVQGAASILNKP